MDLKKISVSNQAFKDLNQHPDKIGDYIALLDNDQSIEVYLDYEGHFYTLTNDESLIEYLEQFDILDDEIMIVEPSFMIRSANINDINIFNETSDNFLSDDSLIKSYILEANTQYSQLLVVEYLGEMIGFVKYLVFEDEVVLNLYTQSIGNILKEDVWSILSK